jgi:pimeloyl-ACP methyl ester carboxylesterase
MATYVLIHGAGSDAWYWHLVTPRLQQRGHTVVAVDLPDDDDDVGLAEYAEVVVDAVGDRPDVILVASRSAALRPLWWVTASRWSWWSWSRP